MAKTQAPVFEDVVKIPKVRVYSADGNPLIFNFNRVGPATWHDLRKADFSDGFTFPTSSKLVPLVSAAAHPENRGSENAQKVLGRWIAGNTLVLLGREGLYGVDAPTVRGERIHMGEKTLKGKLGSREDKGVTFSDDGRVRFTPYDFQTGEMSTSQLASNRGIVVAHGGFENAELLAQAASHYRLQPYFACAKQAPEKPITKVPGVCAIDDLDYRLDVICSDEPGDYGWYSFGVSKDAGGARAPKN